MKKDVKSTAFKLQASTTTEPEELLGHKGCTSDIARPGHPSENSYHIVGENVALFIFNRQPEFKEAHQLTHSFIH